jgi:hypothetical protein
LLVALPGHSETLAGCPPWASLIQNLDQRGHVYAAQRPFESILSTSAAALTAAARPAMDRARAIAAAGSAHFVEFLCCGVEGAFRGLILGWTWRTCIRSAASCELCCCQYLRRSCGTSWSCLGLLEALFVQGFLGHSGLWSGIAAVGCEPFCLMVSQGYE